MENTNQHPVETSLDHADLFLASDILLDVIRAVRDIQLVVSVILCYVTVGLSIASNMIGLIVHVTSDQAEILP
jgi:hypothetical protein